MESERGKMVAVYETYDVPRVVIISQSNKVGVYGNRDNDEGETGTMILTAFMFELIEFNGRPRLV